MRIIYITELNLSPGPLDLSGATAADWGVNKSLIKAVKVETVSTDWDLDLVDSFGSNSMLPVVNLIQGANGDQMVMLDLPYEDMDVSQQVHLQYTDNAPGGSTADITIWGVEAI